jgi:hypothetical protein
VITGDANGGAYIVSAAQGAQYLRKVDPDGNPIHWVTPNVGKHTTIATVDASGNVDAALTTFPPSGGTASGYLAKIAQRETSSIRTGPFI